MKNYLVHYHIYKNAGSTIDNAIKKSFGKNSLLELDKHPKYKDSAEFNEDLIDTVIEEGGDYTAFSSHRMTPTVHRSKKYNFLPLVCLRHPLLRAGSVYRYEKIRPDDKPGKEFAQELDFPEWLKWSMNNAVNIESRNYQTTLLSIPDVSRREAGGKLVDLELVKSRIDEMPVVGVVEYFEETCRLLEAYVGTTFPAFEIGAAHDNRTKAISDWKDELKKIQKSLPRSILIEFEEKNAMDYDLFWYGVGKLRKLRVPELVRAC